jgi:hypothetical protein
LPISKKVNSKQLLIPTLIPEHLRNSNDFIDVPKEPYQDYIEKDIIIRLGAIIGHSPKPLTIKISEIVDKEIIEKT